MHRLLLGIFVTVFACDGGRLSIVDDVDSDTDASSTGADTDDDDLDTDDGVDEETDVPLPPGAHVGVASSLAFGPHPPECSVSKPLVLTNLGGEPLVIASISLAGADAGVFGVSPAGPHTLLPGDTLVLDVGFIPAEEGDYGPVELVIVSNDVDDPEVRVSVTGTGALTLPAVDVFTQPLAAPSDILWVVEKSAIQIPKLVAASQAFFSTLDDIGADFHVGVTTVDTPCPGGVGCGGRLIDAVFDKNTADVVTAFEDAVLAVEQGDENGIVAARAALSSPMIGFAPNSSFLRSSARLNIVVFSDEDDAAAGADPTITPAFITWLDALKASPADSMLSGIVGPNNAVGCLTALPARKYHEAIAGTGGVWHPICDEDLDPAVRRVAFESSGLFTSFELTHQPTGRPTDATVEVDGVAVPYDRDDGWEINSRILTFPSDEMPGPGTVVTVRYRYGLTCAP